MLEELSNSKMFWLVAAIISGLILGAITKRLVKTRLGLGAVSMPFIGAIMVFLIIKFVKLNVAYYEVKYTLVGLTGILLIAILLGFLAHKANQNASPLWSGILVFFGALSMIVFYIFYKESLPINTTQCQPPKDIYLLLKKEDAGYYQINGSGIGYTGITSFINGFRPEFLNAGKDEGIYSHTPVPVELPTKLGKAHALFFKYSGKDSAPLDMDSLFDSGTIKSSELILGDLPK